MMIGKKLRELRNAKGITADALCKELGITVGSYRNYERNDRNPPYETLIKIADYYNVTLDYLLGREPQKEKPYHLGLEKGLKEAYLSLPKEVRAQILQAMLDAVMSYQEEENQNNYITQITTIGTELDRRKAEEKNIEAKNAATG
ncbi:MAG: helix-turn-helix domain-containing protein [Oscillospiraceae bacterium]|nr:helix-turn-helix domain-containing protein [Oscillospiraceae bacterium]